MKQSDYDKKLYNREALIMDVTEDFLIVMEDKGVKKSDLAKMLCKSKSFITQTLSGSRNVTLRTLADMAYVLGAKVKISFETDTQQQYTNIFNNDDYFVDAVGNTGLIVKPLDSNQDSNIKFKFASNDHHYETRKTIWSKVV